MTLKSWVCFCIRKDLKWRDGRKRRTEEELLVSFVKLFSDEKSKVVWKYESRIPIKTLKDLLVLLLNVSDWVNNWKTIAYFSVLWCYLVNEPEKVRSIALHAYQKVLVTIFILIILIGVAYTSQGSGGSSNMWRSSHYSVFAFVKAFETTYLCLF